MHVFFNMYSFVLLRSKTSPLEKIQLFYMYFKANIEIMKDKKNVWNESNSFKNAL